MFKIGIIGAGWIAEKMAQTVAPLKDVENYAIASRDIGKASAFAKSHGFTRAYGFYRELVDDPEVDLVYIATPHSHHFEHASLALEAGKPVLVEKAFTANARQADDLLNLAHRKGLFITEAIWPRYMPLALRVKELLDGGAIGTPMQLSATLCYPMMDKERILRPELCGGALLDVGVYCLHFARMYFGGDIARTASSCLLTDQGIDSYNSMTLYYSDGRVAQLQSSALSRDNRQGIITGTEGFMIIDNVNSPEGMHVYDLDYQLREEYFSPKEQITGYEYQVLASRDAISQGLLESPYITHQETLEVMKMMDAFRAEWGVKFPMD
ncbi:MAG: Gfo/Idh/MocA family oxidoreductase [Prevotella sp.]|nr:Gfo/Idh/MocA family oxidoreductase [Prevotella sp.]